MYQSIHLNLLRLIIIIFVSGLFLQTFSCKILPSNECEIPVADAKTILGSQTVFLFTRYDSRLQINDDGRRSPYFKACGYVTGKNTDFPFVHLYNREYENLQKA